MNLPSTILIVGKSLPDFLMMATNPFIKNQQESRNYQKHEVVDIGGTQGNVVICWDDHCDIHTWN
jgi:hypothetical protein